MKRKTKVRKKYLPIVFKNLSSGTILFLESEGIKMRKVVNNK